MSMWCVRRRARDTPGAPPTLDWGRECARLGTAVNKQVGYPLPAGGSDELTLHREQRTCANRVTARTTTEGPASGDPP